AMFEDLARNLEVPHALGMTTVLVVPERTREVFRESWELAGGDAAHVDHVTHDLGRFLEAISGQRGAPSLPPPASGGDRVGCGGLCHLSPLPSRAFTPVFDGL